MAKFPSSYTVSDIKNQIKQNRSSYHNIDDILAELIQNAKDSIVARKEAINSFKNGKIRITIDKTNLSISVTDNGIGMSKERLNNAVQLNSSGKYNDKNAIGEKGIGLNYVIFEGNGLSIETSNGKEKSYATAKNAKEWLYNDNNQNPFEIKVNDLNKSFNVGTTVTISNITGIDEFFGLNFDQFKFLIRTRTAIGNTKVLWDKNNDDNISTQLICKDDDNTQKDLIPNSYYFLDEVDKQNQTTLANFEKHFGHSRNTDAQKREYLDGKYIIISGEQQIKGHNNNRTLHYCGYFAPESDDWNKRSKYLNLLNDNDKQGYAKIHNGITVSVKGMPTGISINSINLRGAAGYVSRLFLIIDDPSVKLDIGRKSIPSRTTGIYKKIAQNVYRSFVNVVQKWGSKRSRPRPDHESIVDTFNKLNNGIPINSPNTNFQFEPKHEGTISGLFFEQMKDQFTGLKILDHGYKNEYDIYATLNNKSVVLEFKENIKSLISDLDKTKYLGDIDYLVMYHFSNKDKRDALNNNLFVDEFNELDEKHLNSSFSIGGAYTNTIYIIEMSKIINNYQN